jgi:hypothetical protein
MSWLFSQALVAEYSEASSLDGEQCALWNGTRMQQASWLPGKTTDTCRLSRSGMTFKPLTDNHGEELLMSYLADFHAPTYQRLAKAQGSKERSQACGHTWQESLVKYDPDTRSWKTAQCLLFGGLDEFSETWPSWGMMRDGVSWAAPMSDCQCLEKESGYWPAPTCEGWGSEGAQRQMLKKVENGVITHEEAERMMVRHFRECVSKPSQKFPWKDGTILNLSFYEHLMGWPHSWTDAQPLATDKFQQWLRLHGVFLAAPQHTTQHND